VWTIGGTEFLKRTAFPLFLLCFMIPIPSVIFNSLTFPLQILASKLAEFSLEALNVPVMRMGNILELPSGPLSVVEACSGIRSLLSLTFLSLVYGRFFEARTGIRVLLFVSTVPIAILANSGRVTVTGLLSTINPELAQGIYHESTGWVIFMLALGILLLTHRATVAAINLIQRRRRA
jgi:exosortase